MRITCPQERATPYWLGEHKCWNCPLQRKEEVRILFLYIFTGAGATTKNCTMLFCAEIYAPKRFACTDLYASWIQKDPPDLSSVCIQIILHTKYKRNVTGICKQMHRKGPKMMHVHKSAYKSASKNQVMWSMHVLHTMVLNFISGYCHSWYLHYTTLIIY